jgi:hypothetical protein
LRGGGDEHLEASGADAPQRIPIYGRSRAATGALRTIFCFVEIGLLDADVFPVDIEFVGDNHGETGLYALADLRILAHDGHDAIRCDADEGGGNECHRRGLRGLSKKFSDGIEMECNEDASAGDSGDAEKTAAVKERGLHRTSFLLSSLEQLRRLASLEL